jgi:teichuronic acid biosynthesis glycosyltransferase TuaC
MKLLTIFKAVKTAKGEALKGRDLFTLTASLIDESGLGSETFIYARHLRMSGSPVRRVSAWLWLAFRCAPKVPPAFWPTLLRIRHSLFILRRLVAAKGPPESAIALSSCADAGYIAFICHRLYGTRHVVWEHQSGYQRRSYGRYDKMIRRITLRDAALTLAVSGELATAIRRELDLPRLRTGTMPIAVPPRFLASPLPAASDPALQRAFVFGAWTRWRPLKRLDLIVAAFERLCEQGLDVRLLLAGPPEKSVWDGFLESRFNSRVDYEKVVGRDDMVAFVNRCDCCVVASDVETFGMPIIEAMARGKPTVATACGGPQDLVTAPELGRLVPVGDLEALTAAMADVATHRDSFDPAAIRSHAERHFSAPILTERWRALVHSLGSDHSEAG